jgi:catechol 2,3-dioxygenase-like lactoylglutathione lyase family enzyme
MLQAKTTFSGFSINGLEPAKKFYSDKLGLKVDSDEIGLRLHLQDGATVFAYQKDDHAPANYTVLNFVVDNIDQAVDELTAQDIEIEHYDSMPQDPKGIMRGISGNMGPDIAWFKDPAGNILSILQES